MFMTRRHAFELYHQVALRPSDRPAMIRVIWALGELQWQGRSTARASDNHLKSGIERSRYRGVTGAVAEGVLPERMGCWSRPLRQESPDGPDEPASSAHD